MADLKAGDIRRVVGTDTIVRILEVDGPAVRTEVIWPVVRESWMLVEDLTPVQAATSVLAE